MCLYSVTKTDNIPDGVGYKVFYKTLDKLITICKGQTSHYAMDKWYNNKEKSHSVDIYSAKTTNKKSEYELGFHLFKTYRDAQIYVMNMGAVRVLQIYKVEYSDVICEGIQFSPSGDDQVMDAHLETIVARNIKLIERW